MPQQVVAIAADAAAVAVTAKDGKHRMFGP